MGDFVCSNLSSLAKGTRLASVSKPRTKRKWWVSQWPGMICITTFKSVMVVQMVKNPPAMQETQVQSLGWKSPWRRAWQPTAVFLPGESHGQRSLVGYSPWGCRVGHAWSNWALAHMWMYMGRVWNDGHQTNLNSFPHFLHGEGGQHEKGWSQGALSEMF